MKAWSLVWLSISLVADYVTVVTTAKEAHREIAQGASTCNNDVRLEDQENSGLIQWWMPSNEASVARESLTTDCSTASET